MSTILVCDVCGNDINVAKAANDSRIPSLVELMQIIQPEVEDLCVSCTDRICKNLRDHPYDEFSNKKKTRNGQAVAMRTRLCELVDKGTRKRGQILIQLAREFPGYTNIDSINKRISELISPEEAYLVTRKLGKKYRGKIAKISKKKILSFP